MTNPTIANSSNNRLGRYAAFIYGLVCYAIFLLTFLYACGFVETLLSPGPSTQLPLSLSAMP